MVRKGRAPQARERLRRLPALFRARLVRNLALHIAGTLCCTPKSAWRAVARKDLARERRPAGSHVVYTRLLRWACARVRSGSRSHALRVSGYGLETRRTSART